MATQRHSQPWHLATRLFDQAILTCAMGALLSDEKTRVGYLSCKTCGQNFSTPTNPLSQPIDVYTDWIDACEEANQANDAVDDAGYQEN